MRFASLICVAVASLLCLPAEARPLILRPSRLAYKAYHYAVAVPVESVCIPVLDASVAVFESTDRHSKLLFPLRLLSFTTSVGLLVVTETVDDWDGGLDFGTAESWYEYSGGK